MVSLAFAVLLLGSSEIPPPVAGEAKGIGERYVRLFFCSAATSGRSRRGPDVARRDGDRLYDRSMSFRWYGIAVDAEGASSAPTRGSPQRVAKIEGVYGDGRRRSSPSRDLRRLRSPQAGAEGAVGAPVPFVEFGEPRFALGDPFYRAEIVLVGAIDTSRSCPSGSSSCRSATSRPPIARSSG